MFNYKVVRNIVKLLFTECRLVLFCESRFVLNPILSFSVQIVGHIQSKMEVIVIKDGKELKLGADINVNIRFRTINILN